MFKTDFWVQNHHLMCSSAINSQRLLTKSRNYHTLEMEAQPPQMTFRLHHIDSHKIATLFHSPIMSRTLLWYLIDWRLFICNSVIYIWGGFQDNTLKDILLKYIFCWTHRNIFYSIGMCYERKTKFFVGLESVDDANRL